MEAERRRQIEAIVYAALDRPAEQRPAFVAEVCGSDADLRQEAESLLAEEGEFDELLESRCLSWAEPEFPATSQFLPGEQLGPYRIESLIGSGGMGEVYRATDMRLNRSVALKLLPRHAHDRRAIERFQREARAASSLNHPNICTLHDVGEHSGRPYLVLEFLEGQTLKQRLAAGPITGDQAVVLGIQIAAALEAAHAKSIVHRDIKPANIFLTQHGKVKVLDFGLAKLVSDPEPIEQRPGSVSTQVCRETTLSVLGLAMGTVAYMSPEQARGEAVDERTDLFSLGATLYQMVTGRQPFLGETPAETIDAIQNRSPARPRELNPRVSGSLERVILKALEKERTARHQKAADLREALERLRPVPRRVGPWIAAALLLALIATLAKVFGWFAGPPSTIELVTRQLTARPTEDPVLRAAISPDGRFVAYPDLRGIHVREIATGETRSVAPPENACFR